MPLFVLVSLLLDINIEKYIKFYKLENVDE